MDPFVKWVGGKRRLIPELEKYLPDSYNRYFEPFVGGGALLLHLQPKVAIINDVNPELINCYSVIRDNLDGLIKALAVHQKLTDFCYYYKIRSQAPTCRVEQAARFIYLIKTGFCGKYSINLKGQFNTSIGNYKHSKICDRENLIAINRYLNTNRVSILCGSFKAATRYAGMGDFVYFDPPYDVYDEHSYTKYYKGGFTRADQQKLFKVFEDLTRRGVSVMLSNSGTPFIQELYRDYTQIKIPIFYNLRYDKRSDLRHELLICNYL